MHMIVSLMEQLGLPSLPWFSSDMQPYVWLSIFSTGVFLLALIPTLWIRASRSKKKALSTAKPASGTSEEKFLKQPDSQVASSAHRLKDGLAKTRGGLLSKLSVLFGRKRIDAGVLEQLEEILFTADVGAKTAQYLFQQMKEKLSATELLDKDKMLTVLREETRRLLEIPTPKIDWESHRPFVLLTIGVNGAGKTTTIGKLASSLKSMGKQVMLAAGDTFRAAAVQQLQIWGERVGVPVVSGKEGGDPSSVIFEGIRQAQQQGADVLIADTAGRLHVKAELMEELKKVRRVIQKADASAPHETWLVVDATNGQNAIAQAATFKEAMDITGIVLTKLDGTAKGGVILGICHELRVPVRFIGVGEKAEDLQPFDKDAFVDALYGD